jgi:hypothetical protein
MPDYAQLSQTLHALCAGETDSVALMATIACELHHAHDLSDWTGFYRVTAPETARGLRGRGAYRAAAIGARCRCLPGPYRLRVLYPLGIGLAGLEPRGPVVRRA